MFVLPSDGAKFSDEAAEIERFRARHRRLCRQQHVPVSTSNVEALDADDGRTRKISAKWRQKQQTQHRNQNEDGVWPQSAGTEMHMGFNAFDFASSPEAFYDKEPVEARVEETLGVEEKRKLHMTHVAKQVTSMGFNSASLWEQSFPVPLERGEPIRQLPAFGHSMAHSLWRPPVSFTTHNNEKQPSYYD
ncbi:hypothetical protein PHMEG_00026157 [Phytophthora megakarya]|uniref:Uncharacterized protein n=1 Tax=Phytophthora megakarya TaxID=4795 RepID=A0A225VA83_9STRA|nr:hypothetical protein PHMEG_00026157 [Phytophthora megakarya]